MNDILSSGPAMDRELRMSETKAPADPVGDRAIDEQITLLIQEIQRETVPERLLELAQRLQKALNARTK